ncbi:MAG: LicD family protein [Prevotella sp.]|nr:LicD family protein [Prevotella sp.]
MESGGVRKITDIQELRSIQMGILDDVHRFCEEQGLRYSLSSGTLIGAVRHKGYIPWDDDIDIYMLRSDYERFLQTYHDPQGRFRVLNPQKESHYYYTFAKVVDQRTRMIEKETAGYEIGVYIDIFPVDYVTEDIKERERIFRLKRLLYKIRRCKISNSNPLHSRLAYWCYRSLPVTVGVLNRWIERLIVRKEPTQTLCHMTEAGPAIKGCFPAKDMETYINLPFENRIYKAMAGYDDHLTRTYGDYMTLPPEDQRTTHQFEAYCL